MSPTVSVVIPTRDRPETLARLLRRIKDQSLRQFECLVIDDGSGADTLARYDQVWKDLDERFVLHLRPAGERGGGPGRARNRGIRAAQGAFIAFCDDDDFWIRDDHLAAAAGALTKHEADLFFANMQTSRDGVIDVADWFAVASDTLRRNSTLVEGDLYRTTRKGMSRFFAHRSLHADMLVVDKRLLTKIGMYYEREFFGEDFDINYRLVDQARGIVFRSTVVANLDVSQHASFIRSHETQERLLFIVLACLRVETQVADPDLRRVARANRAWTLAELARAMLQDGRRREARELAAQALLLHPSMGSLRLVGETILGWPHVTTPT